MRRPGSVVCSPQACFLIDQLASALPPFGGVIRALGRPGDAHGASRNVRSSINSIAAVAPQI